MLKRLQQIINLSNLNKSQKTSLILLQSKQQERILNRMKKIDAEDMYTLSKVLFKLEDVKQNREFILDCYIQMSERVE